MSISIKIILLMGLGDVFTGLSLLLAPEFTFSILHIPRPYPLNFFIQFIGIFVFAVGFTYLLPHLHHLLKHTWDQNLWLNQVYISAFIRICVALFLCVLMFRHQIPLAWITVAVYDLMCGIYQGILLGIKNEST